MPGDRITPRRDGADPGELRLLVRSADTACCSFQIPLGGHTHGQERLDLGCEEHFAVHDRVVEGLDAEAIADRNNHLLAFIGNDDCELAAQLAGGLQASLVVQVQDLAVALGREPVATGPQTIANLAIAVELAVDDQVNGAVGLVIGCSPLFRPMMDNRVCPSVQRPSRDVQLPEPSGPRCCKLLSAAARRSDMSPRRVIAAKIPHIGCIPQQKADPRPPADDASSAIRRNC